MRVWAREVAGRTCAARRVAGAAQSAATWSGLGLGLVRVRGLGLANPIPLTLTLSLTLTLIGSDLCTSKQSRQASGDSSSTRHRGCSRCTAAPSAASTCRLSKGWVPPRKVATRYVRGASAAAASAAASVASARPSSVPRLLPRLPAVALSLPWARRSAHAACQRAAVSGSSTAASGAPSG